MTETATSPRSTIHRTTSSRSSRPGTTPSVKSTNSTSSNTSSMPPLFSPRLPTPQQQTPTPKTPSPNYFGFQGGDTSFLTEAGGNQSHQNWSPPSSAVRSTAAISPTVIPLDQNPDFEAFRQQSEGKAFSLGGFGAGHLKTPSISLRHPSGRRVSKTSPLAEDSRPGSEPRGVPTRSLHGKTDSLDPATSELSQSPKRLLSPGSLHLPEASRRGSPASFVSAEHGHKTARTESSPDKAPRFQLPLDSVPRSMGLAKHRAETLPSPGAGAEDHVMTTPQHVVTLMQSSPELLLLLDLRVQTQYATSHISSSLSLCIPTTLLKRPSFNVQKLAETFKDGETKARFENWRKSKYIIVYDNSSTQLKDAQTCMNTIKKFNAEGYGGTMYIIRGGFADFSRTFPQFVESGSPSQDGGTSGQGVAWDGPKVAPVVGGCPMPGTDQPANPFFGNIRQNMDLIGGVGQIELQHPAKSTAQLENSHFPRWLKSASEEKDQGKRVSNKFEAIERREKKRMEDALSSTVSYGSSPKESENDSSVQIAGLEKGTKNRYNNIWPFEHSRVKLQGIPSSGCDYFNANHIKANWSNKRYISTQAPIPATFNDFWNVIWQQDVRVIVMLTAEKEGAQVKAHNYWDMKQYGPLRLEFLSEKKASLEPDRIQRHKQRPVPGKRSSMTTAQLPLAQIENKDINKANNADQPYVVVRRFTLSHEGFPFQRMREITQLQYSSWPDFGAPAHPAHLLGLVEQTDAVVRVTEKTKAEEPEHPNPRPVLVHCSAGCGRTGTFCTVDSVIDMLKRQHITKQQQHNNYQHQTTAMEIDNPKNPNHVSRQQHHSDDGGYLASQFQDSREDIEGSWVLRDDLDLIEKTVEDFRHQRLSMVQSLRQFVLCYESIMEWLIYHKEVSVF